MNILYIETSLAPHRGGVQKVTWNISKFLEANGFNIFFAYHLVDYDKIPESNKIKFSLSWTPDKFFDVLSSFIKINKIDIIISQDRTLPFYTETYKRIKKEKICKIIHCVHQSPDFFKHIKIGMSQKIKNILYMILHGKSFRKIQEQSIYSIADRTVLLSELFLKDYIKINDIKDQGKLSAISNPLSFVTYVTENEIMNKEKIVLIITRFEEKQKNTKSALRVWSKVFPKIDDTWKLVLAGYGEDEKMILDYAKELKLKKFEFIGKILSPEEYYEKASIFMMTSHYEGFGITLTESQQKGCIPIAFNTYNAVKDIIIDEYNGYIIPPYDEQLYAEKMIELINDKEKMVQMQFNAVKSSEKFDIKNIGTKWINLLNGILNDE